MSLTGEVTSPTASDRSDVPSARSVFLRIALLALAIRIALEALGLASLSAHGEDALSGALELWNRWDGPHYLRVAEVGYRRFAVPGENPDDPLYIVFFPFFPLAVRIVSIIFRDLILSGLVVSYAASVGAATFLYRLVRLDADHRQAWRAVLLLFAFPTAYFLAAPYTEALFLFGIVGSMYTARTARWTRAGLLGALATGTRVAGLALAPALVVEALVGRATSAERARRLALGSLAAIGAVVYLAINQIVHDDAFWFLHVQRDHWFQHAVLPWVPIFDAIRLVGSSSGGHTFIFAARLAGFLFAVPFLVLAVKRLRPADWVYAWAGFVLLLSASWLISLPRYLLGLYPIFMVLAGLTESRRVFWPLIVVSVGAQAYFFWTYSAGPWTF